VLIVVAHCDDEVIFAGGALASDEPEYKKLLVIFDSSRRNEQVRQIAQCASAELRHCLIDEFNDEYSQESIAGIIEDEIKNSNPDVLITHNAFGEYGHKSHRLVSGAVDLAIDNTNKDIRLLHFGFCFPSIYVYGKTPWEDSLKSFSNVFPWKKYADYPVMPFSGIFRTKHADRYFYHSTNCYFPKINAERHEKFSKIYEGVFSWKRNYESMFELYREHNIEFYFDPAKESSPPLSYTPPKLALTRVEPHVKKGNPKPGRAGIIRSLMEDFLIDYLHFEGRGLWVGWNKFCRHRGYKKDMLRYADSIEIIDHQETRLNEDTYGDCKADYIGDICDVKSLINDDTFDWVHCFGVLEYVDNIENAVSEIMRITKSGGRVLLGVVGEDYNMTGKNRPSYKYICNLIKKYNGIAIESWTVRNQDFSCIHIYKK
jgi:SAM-dependent methyltransferase